MFEIVEWHYNGVLGADRTTAYMVLPSWPLSSSASRLPMPPEHFETHLRS